MRKLTMIIAAAAGLLLSACVEENLVEPQEQRPDILGDPVTITVGVPGSQPATRVELGGAKGLSLTWEEGDQLVVAGFGEKGYIGTADFTIQSDFAGQKSAMFDGHKIKGATSYVVYYKTPNLIFDANGAATMSYENMSSAAAGSAEVVSDHLFLQSETINDPELGTGNWKLTALNSVLKVDFQNCPRNLVRVNAIDWNIVQADGKDRKTMRLRYTGPGATLTGSTFNFGTVYFCFDPEAMSLQPGESMCFRLNGEGGSNFSYTKLCEKGLKFDPAKRYTAAVNAYNEPIADIFDGYFTKDGECHDLSINGRGVNLFPGSATHVAIPDGYNNLAAYFNHTFGKQPTSGAYTFPDSGLSAKFSDGYSMEAYVMCNVYPASMGAESKAFGSTNGGGTALMITKNKHLAFLTCGKIKPDTGQYWQFAESDVTPVVGTWYHLVGVYDGKTGHQKFYIDGELKSDKYIGIINYHPNQLAAPFWGIGANSWSGSAENPKFNNAWNGAVARPRIYSIAMDDAQVKAVYNQFKHVNPAPVVPEKPAVPKADLLDVVFHADGSATDVSQMGMIVEHFSGSSLVAYPNKLYQRNAARFTNEVKSAPASGYYKVNYEMSGNVNPQNKCTEFVNKLKDGHSIEVLFSTAENLDDKGEVKLFSSTEKAGVAIESNNGHLTYLSNISSKWKFCDSGVRLEPGRFYHAVGIWDPAAKETRIYVDGQLKNTLTVDGELNLAKEGSQWFGLGVDPFGSKTSNAWNGDLVIARIYDAVLDQSQVSALYEQVKVSNPVLPNTIKLSNVRYLSSCRIAPGYKYHIYGTGFTKDDVLSLDPMTVGEKTIWPSTVFDANTGELIVTIPSSLKSGKYRLVLKRNSDEYLIGITHFMVDNNASVENLTKVIAHRCYQGNHPANSLAAFKDTENRNIWGAEIDVHLTSDKLVAVDHDGFLDNVWDDAHRFSNHTWAEISKAHKDVSRLDDFLQAMTDGSVPNLNMVLEIKDQKTDALDLQLVDKCLALIQEHPQLKKRICWIAFDIKVCEYIHSKTKADPEWKDCMIMYLKGDLTPQQCLDKGIRGIDYSAGRLATHNQWISEAHDLNMVVNVWTVNNQPDMINFISKGVDFITTDHPDTLNELLKLQFITK